jgi:hypothetical protein
MSKSRISRYRRLLELEVMRHPRHIAVRDKCESFMQVEYVPLPYKGYLTGQIDNRAPYRLVVKREEQLVKKFTTLVKVLLESEPISFLDPTKRRYWLSDEIHWFVRRGWNSYEIGFLHLFIRSGRGLVSAPGVAFRFFRGLDIWNVGLQAIFAFDLGGLTGRINRIQLSMYTSLEFQWTYILSPLANISLYFSIIPASFQLFQFEGMIDYGDTIKDETTTDLVFSFGGRIGIEFLRISDLRFDIWIGGYLPTHKTHDPDSELVNAWTVSFLLGAGIQF